jgi:hypothetical protein
MTSYLHLPLDGWLGGQGRRRTCRACILAQKCEAACRPRLRPSKNIWSQGSSNPILTSRVVNNALIRLASQNSLVHVVALHQIWAWQGGVRGNRHNISWFLQIQRLPQGTKWRSGKVERKVQFPRCFDLMILILRTWGKMYALGKQRRCM